ncbi:MAG: aldehyde ferredoxin oxidoreductase N-terminal domain-containing protein [Nitrososphaerota archaeon]
MGGLGTLEACERIKEDLGDKDASVLAIGPAGENLVRFACVTGSGLWVMGEVALEQSLALRI